MWVRQAESLRRIPILKEEDATKKDASDNEDEDLVDYRCVKNFLRVNAAWQPRTKLVRNVEL